MSGSIDTQGVLCRGKFKERQKGAASLPAHCFPVERQIFQHNLLLKQTNQDLSVRHDNWSHQPHLPLKLQQIVATNFNSCSLISSVFGYEAQWETNRHLSHSCCGEAELRNAPIKHNYTLKPNAIAISH